MELQTISTVSKNFNISTRTLRYYEQIGLIQSIKKEGYAYRTYDEKSIIKLEQIIILRKLRIQLKEIQLILQNEEASIAIGVFQKKINEFSNEITALSTIKSILEEFITRLKENFEVKISSGLLADESMLKIIDSLTVTKINFKEEKSMSDLNRANETLSKLTDVRIVYLPPATVASIRHIGGLPELTTASELNNFIMNNQLAKIKPDFRHYGFNHPNGEMADGSDHGYERWVTIPSDMEVIKPFEKKEFSGGLYAAHAISMGNFEEWNWLCDWAKNNPEYEPNWGNPECMYGLMEEHLNYINLYTLNVEENHKWQLDLLIPIRPKVK
ncbi:effector binding domain-containing protein [Desnuesiella massiliensis]|uniref:effector binding domain-containing protein n=1 Tax=Desnuesiella massiliensis TaxID=1650662 RepID=UPI0006E27CE9|nr:effector binding domain-containing protein [Desnuesiella massiliensis]